MQQLILEDIETLGGVDFSTTPMPQTQQEATILLATLQSNSIVKIKNNLSLTDADLIEVFGSLDHPDIAHFGMILTALENVEISSIDPWNICNQRNVYIKCLLETILPCDAISKVKEMMDHNGSSGAISGGAFYTAWSAYTAAERKIILKGIMQLASKYAGPLAVVSAAIDFSWCLATNNGSEVGNPASILVAITTISNLLPTPLSNSITYWSTALNLYDDVVDKSIDTSIFFNSADSKYYVDS